MNPSRLWEMDAIEFALFDYGKPAGRLPPPCGRLNVISKFAAIRREVCFDKRPCHSSSRTDSQNCSSLPRLTGDFVHLSVPWRFCRGRVLARSAIRLEAGLYDRRCFSGNGCRRLFVARIHAAGRTAKQTRVREGLRKTRSMTSRNGSLLQSVFRLSLVMSVG